MQNAAAVVARTDFAYQSLSEQVAERTVRRVYRALVCGHMKEDRGTIRTHMDRSRRDRRLMTVSRKGREAVTHYRVIEPAGPCDLLEVRLESGRTHQIRVHLRHLGKPVFGDPVYGGRGRWASGLPVSDRARIRDALARISRQALHASSLGFNHPRTGEQLQFESEVPQDIREAAEILRG